MPMPISICCNSIQSPESDAGCTIGMDGRPGAIAADTAIARMRRVRLGIPALLHSGAVAINASMRANGKINAAIQASICVEAMLITASR